MTANDIRQKYLDFFKAKGHAIIPSSPLVPDNDPTTLFTGSGMQPMLQYLLGETHPLGKRIADSQKCFRSQDIEEVGDDRHSTFYEMLGNWSLGDYFKQEQLKWCYTFLTQEIKLDPQKLYVSVFSGNKSIGVPEDTEAVTQWVKLFSDHGLSTQVIKNPEKTGMKDGRIFYYDDSKNWWSRAGAPANMPIGEPGGPTSEVFYDFGVQYHLHEKSVWKQQPCHINCDCGRFFEICNSVFMTYKKTPQGFKPLRQKNIDFGGGLERIAAAANDNPDMFTTSLFMPIIEKLEEISSQKYTQETKYSFQVIADHIRGAVMLAADGVYPSNKEQGYFSRRLIRRTIRHAKLIGVETTFTSQLVPVITDMYRDAYPEVAQHQQKITTVLEEEEKKFHTALQKGLREIEKIAKLDAKIAFQLYERYGFPLELTQEIAREKGQTIDTQKFEVARKKHSDKSRAASAGKFKGGLADHSEATTKLHTATHLLHQALRQVLGEQVKQEGSNITADRLRFDFQYSDKITDQQLSQIEDLVNQKIAQDLPVHKTIEDKDAAIKSGALAFFKETYPNKVSVYTIGRDTNKGWFSKELCGGPHVTSTGKIGGVTIKKVKSIGANLRRVYVVFK